MRIGWMSTGRDQAACNLLADVVARARRDGVSLDIAAAFCDRDIGEAPESDAFLSLAGGLGIRTITLSSAASWHAAKTTGVSREVWRDAYHEQVTELLRPLGLSVLVMAGYMLIASADMCREHALLNLHPALPGGPTGTWQEVIWELLDREATETGAMMHLATEELDRGPVIAFFRFPITGGAWEPLWDQFRAKRSARGLTAIMAEEGEREPLFAEVRRWGEVRESPLLYQTLCQFSSGKLRAEGDSVLAGAAHMPLDLTCLVEAEMVKQ